MSPPEVRGRLTAQSVPGGHVSTEPPALPRPWSCSRHLQQQVGPSQVSWCPLWTIDPEALVLIGPPREKRPHGPEESKRSLEKEQQRRSSPRRRCGSSEESAAPEESAPPPDWSHDSPWTRSRGRAAVEEQGAAGPEDTLRRRASSQNHQEPEEKKKRSSSTAEQELSHQQGATSTPELLEDSQSQQAEPAGGATEHQNPAQPVGRSLTSPSSFFSFFSWWCPPPAATGSHERVSYCGSSLHFLFPESNLAISAFTIQQLQHDCCTRSC